MRSARTNGTSSRLSCCSASWVGVARDAVRRRHRGRGRPARHRSGAAPPPAFVDVRGFRGGRAEATPVERRRDPVGVVGLGVGRGEAASPTPHVRDDVRVGRGASPQASSPGGRGGGRAAATSPDVGGVDRFGRGAPEAAPVVGGVERLGRGASEAAPVLGGVDRLGRGAPEATQDIHRRERHRGIGRRAPAPSAPDRGERRLGPRRGTTPSSAPARRRRGPGGLRRGRGASAPPAPSGG